MTKKEKRIVYIENAVGNLLMQTPRTYHTYKFYKFTDSLTDETILISISPKTKLTEVLTGTKDVFLTLEEFAYKIWSNTNTPKPAAYYNARLLTQKQIAKVKEQYAELFV